MKILFLASEVAPWSKSGGLADVAQALPAALARRGHQVLVVSPCYQSVPREKLERLQGASLSLRLPFGQVTSSLWGVEPEPNLSLVFIDQPELFARAGFYGHGDDARRFGFFSVAGLAVAQVLGHRPDVVHLNDWQSALAALALRLGFSTSGLARARSVLTIHNLAYQGSFDKHAVSELGLPWSGFTAAGFEFYDRLSFLKAGLVYADALTTVSPSYALEIQTKEGGQGLDGVLRSRAGQLTGILNGVDPLEWNPAADHHLPAAFSTADLAGKETCAFSLLRRMGLSLPPLGGTRPPLFGSVGRLADQKGAELSQQALPGLLDRGAQAVVVGSGEPALERRWLQLAERYRGRLAVHIGFDEALAHQVEAGADFFLMPSKFEPCGLNQMYSLRYGAVPIVRGVGGLKDTVVDLRRANPTGIVFEDYSAHALWQSLERAWQLFKAPQALREVRLRGMAQDFSWSAAAAKYEALYEGLLPSSARTLG